MSDAMIAYRIEVVGGPFDGSPGMRWLDDGEHPPPAYILLGTCPGDASCASGEAACARQRRAHAYYWLPDEPSRPKRTVPYELSEAFREPETRARMGEYPARAIYTIGGLHLPAGPVERELAGRSAVA